MPGSASARLAERYALQLSSAWQSWFDEQAASQRLAGQFRQPLAVDDLIEHVPADLWPGFMLPDTLPIVSNDYGDWWCVRVGSDNQITEVIQWMHAGGDWLPVGASIFEAILWDSLQRWRGQFAGRQPAAHEYPKRPGPEESAREQQLANLTWLAEHLTTSAAHLQQLLDHAAAGDYRISLELLQQHNWSDFAAACELIEVHLQGGLVRLADAGVANRCGINWTPDFTSWLFDTDRISTEGRTLLHEHCPGLQFTQDWHAAGARAEQVLQRRGDLGWAGDIAGWAAERRGDEKAAIAHYFQHRHSSAFTDQSVRLRSHWFNERYGKFSVAQLARLYDRLTPQQREDPYLQIFWHETSQRVRPAVREYWLARARLAEQQQDFAAAYDAYYRAGWDLGAERLSDYVEILDGLTRSAAQAEWQARAIIAQTHADSLRRRLIIP